ncbi:MAG TPA: hypothetical protein VMG12_42080 [Polyangiaceae bacterium]|nr:hypothetical protein [Polyangiaceae bacterium]
MAILERVSDEQGSIVLGWAHAGVFYARFERSISCGVAERFARRFSALVAGSVGVRYFGDSSAVTSYEPQAMLAITAAMAVKPQRFEAIVVRPWQGALGAPAGAFAEAVGCLEFVTTAGEFERRLRAAIPGGDIGTICGVNDGAASSPPLVDSVPSPARTAEKLAYSYVFDLSDFESGRFTATRSEHLGERSRSGWVCVARDDQQALALARQAAIVEWAAPASRRPEDFSVEFQRFEMTRDRPFDRRR